MSSACPAPPRCQTASGRLLLHFEVAWNVLYPSAKAVHAMELITFSDLRLIVRQLRRARGFALTAVVTLALGVAANVVAFGVLDALLLRKLPVRSPDQLSFVQHPESGNVSLSFPQYRDLRARNRSFTEMGAYDLSPVGVALHGKTEQQLATLATGSYFDLLGIRPVLGRFPTAADDARGENASPFVVLTYDTWQHDFYGDPNVIGRALTLSTHPFTIIGVAPAGFYGTERFVRPTMWVEIWNASQLVGEGELNNRASQWSWVIGRRKPGVTVAQAAADLNGIAKELAREYPKTDERTAFALAEPGYIGDLMGPALHAFLGGIMLMALLVLAAACVNLGGLYAARAADRRRSIAIRMALGSTHWRVVMEVLLESMLLGLVGGALGCALARVALHALTNYRPPFEFPLAVAVEPTAAVYLFALLLSVLAGLVCGIVPAREARKTELHEVIKSGTLGIRERRRRWTLRDALLLVEVALCCVLVTASVVSLRGLLLSRRAALGFDPNGVVLVSYNLAISGYEGDRTFQFNRNLAEQAARIPGVASVAFSSNTPLNTGGNFEKVYRSATTDFRPGTALFSAESIAVSPSYFRTAGTALLTGRDFTWVDDANAPRVAVVNQRFAKLVYGDRPAVGETFSDGHKGLIHVIGVAEQGKYATLNEDPVPAYFTPMAQGADMYTKLLLRVQPAAIGDTPRITSAAAALVHAQDPGVPISGAGTWGSALAPALFPARAATVALGVMGGLALVLAISGIFGLASYTVAQRMRELGIRVALGAARGAVLRTALGRTARVVITGSIAGAIVGLASTRLLAAIVYGARASDPWVLLAVALTMVGVGCAATAAPAHRALNVEPVILLREQ